MLSKVAIRANVALLILVFVQPSPAQNTKKLESEPTQSAEKQDSDKQIAGDPDPFAAGDQDPVTSGDPNPFATNDNNPFSNKPATANRSEWSPFGGSVANEPQFPAIEIDGLDEMSVEDKLKLGVPMDFFEVEMGDILYHLSKSLKINLVLDHSAQDDSLSHDTSATFQCNENLPLEKSLELLLSPFNACLVVEESVVRIISKDVESDADYGVVKIFDARDLITQMTQQRMAAYANDDEPPYEWEIQMIVQEELLNTIQKIVTPELWYDNGGELMITNLDGLLVVNGPRRSLNGIGQLLNQLSDLTRASK